ncbi:MAG: glycosyltransferase [Candidatus Omnitrophica bacterium]|nr:glycosyltransferase [Candidatus Omnitrophota bacterium]MDD5653710.1 glycosyltransferase [Candidatus Omnitrophota bacterium]
MTENSHFKFSVVIPTFNRASDLKRCLDALRMQTFLDFETIIVDNGCTDGTAELLKHYSVRVVKDVTRNVTHLFNAGWKSAKAGIVVFTNDDAQPIPTWLEEINLAFEKFPDAAAVGGPTVLPKESMNNQEMIRLDAQAKKSWWLKPFAAVYESLVLGGKFREIGVLCDSGAYSVGGSLIEAMELPAPIYVDLLSITNAAIKLNVLKELNGLDENFKFTHGDGDLFVRMRKKGLKLIFTPQALVWHHVNPGGDTRAAFWRGRDQAFFLKKCIRPKTIAGRFRLMLNVLFFNAFWVYKAAQKLDLSFLNGISGYFRGLKDFKQARKAGNVS